MPIASHSPTQPVISAVDTPRIEPKQYQGIIIDTLTTPANSLTAYVEGAPWVGTYFSQVTGKHNDLREVDVSSPNVYQQYHCIKGMELRVNSDLSNSYDQEKATMAVSGSATVFGGVVPKKADYFVAGGFRGRVAIYRVTSTERMTHNSESVYSVNYTMDGYTDTIPEIYNALLQKTTQTYVFSKDRLLHGVSPLVREEQQDFMLNLSIEYTKIATYYVHTFLDKVTGTFLLPGQTQMVYDYALTNFVVKTISASLVNELNYVRQLGIDRDYFGTQKLLWNVLLTRDHRDLALVCKKTHLLSRMQFMQRILNKGAAHSGPRYFVCPFDVDTSTVIGERYVPQTGVTEEELLTHTKNVNGVLASAYVPTYTQLGETSPLLYPVLYDDYYVFSVNFYTSTTDISVLESMVLDYLHRRPINMNMLAAVLNTIYEWPRLEQFYYVPIVLLMIQQAKYQDS